MLPSISSQAHGCILNTMMIESQIKMVANLSFLEKQINLDVIFIKFTKQFFKMEKIRTDSNKCIFYNSSGITYPVLTETL